MRILKNFVDSLSVFRVQFFSQNILVVGISLVGVMNFVKKTFLIKKYVVQKWN